MIRGVPLPRAQDEKLGAVDLALLVVFLLGIYTGYELRLTPEVPIPATASGAAGMILLWRRRDDIATPHLAGLMAVALVYLASILSASDYGFLAKRFTGLVQLLYSLVIAYALFLTVLRARRDQLAGLFLGFCVAILVGCVLEVHTPLRAVSDAVRNQIYSFGVYASDLRDELLYGKIRPKLFTSEPSAVTFAYTLFAFGWLVASRWRWKLAAYLALLAGGLATMPGPTLLLLLPLLGIYYLGPLGPDQDPRDDRMERWLKAGLLGCAGAIAFAILATSVYSERLGQVSSGSDPSFFYRVIGPALTAFDTIARHPWAGAGLTGENFIANDMLNVFIRSPHFSAAWKFDRAAEVLTNYFWLHWIYLGLVWGVIALAAMTLWLRALGPRDVAFAWLAWAILGQASGAYVGPKTWVVLFLSLALAVKARRHPAWARPNRPPVAPALGWAEARALHGNPS